MRTIMPFLLMLLAMPARAGLVPLSDEPDFARGWRAEVTPRRCVLRQDSPLFGEVRFVRDAAGPLRLVVEWRLGAVRGGEARIRALLPPWRTADENGEPPAVSVSGERRYPVRSGVPALVVGEGHALALLQMLYSGLMLQIDLPPQGEGGFFPRLRLLPVGFRAAAEQFAHCVGRIGPPPDSGKRPPAGKEGQRPRVPPISSVLHEQAPLEERVSHPRPDRAFEMFREDGPALTYRRGGEHGRALRIRLP